MKIKLSELKKIILEEFKAQQKKFIARKVGKKLTESKKKSGFFNTKSGGLSSDNVKINGEWYPITDMSKKIIWFDDGSKIRWIYKDKAEEISESFKY